MASSYQILVTSFFEKDARHLTRKDQKISKEIVGGVPLRGSQDQKPPTMQWQDGILFHFFDTKSQSMGELL